MDMLTNFNKVMEYIETHLEEEIDFNMASKIAGVSEYHFRKMFSYLSGMTLSSYITVKGTLNNLRCLFILI